MNTTTNPAPEPTTTPKPTPQTEFRSIVQQANKGDREALVRLRQTLDANPSVWTDISRTAIESERVLVDQIAGGDRLIEESVRRTLDQMRTDLAGGTPSPAERMAVDRVIVAWLFLQLADKALAADRGSALPQAQFTLKRHDLAGRQYHAAMRSLHDLQSRLPKTQPGQSTQAGGLRIFDGDGGQPTGSLPPTGTCSKP